MKRRFAAVCALLLCLSLSACGCAGLASAASYYGFYYESHY